MNEFILSNTEQRCYSINGFFASLFERVSQEGTCIKTYHVFSNGARLYISIRTETTKDGTALYISDPKRVMTGASGKLSWLNASRDDISTVKEGLRYAIESRKLFLAILGATPVYE